MGEFEIIQRYFSPLTMGKESSVFLRDDAAVIDIPVGYELVITSDTLNSGTHFFADSPPGMIAHKALRTNLSDLASMGATPLSYQLNIAFPQQPTHDWLTAFSNALLSDQEHYGIYCSGGDTTSIEGPLSISITALGIVKKGHAWRRTHAKDEDQLVVTDYVGDAWIGLQILRGKIKSNDDEYFIDRYHKPRVKFFKNSNIRAGVDISDGLISDINHICIAANLGAEIKLEEVPFSPQAQKLIVDNIVRAEDLITGGDDYILALSLPQNTTHNFYKIGHFSATTRGVLITHDGKNIDLMTRTGWTHF